MHNFCWSSSSITIGHRAYSTEIYIVGTLRSNRNHIIKEQNKLITVFPWQFTKIKKINGKKKLIFRLPRIIKLRVLLYTSDMFWVVFVYLTFHFWDVAKAAECILSCGKYFLGQCCIYRFSQSNIQLGSASHLILDCLSVVVVFQVCWLQTWSLRNIVGTYTKVPIMTKATDVMSQYNIEIVVVDYG